jgi:hypothetical protein
MNAQAIHNLIECRNYLNGKQYKDLTQDERRILYVCQLWKNGKTFDHIEPIISDLIDKVSKQKSPDTFIHNELSMTFKFDDDTIIEPLLYD